MPMESMSGGREYIVGPLLQGSLEDLRKLFNEVRELGYTIVGPKLVDGVIRYEILNSFDDIPYGYEDIQEPGSYRVVEGQSFRHGPDSPKKFLYPPELVLLRIRPDWSIEIPRLEEKRIAFFGIKPCDLAAIEVMDRVLGYLGDEHYINARRDSLIVVENCTRPGKTCFCASMGTGPEARWGFDVSYTVLSRDTVVIRPGSDVGLKLVERLGLEPPPLETVRRLRRVLEEARRAARAPFSAEELPDLLEHAMDSPVFREVAEKCLGCGSCSMVCPTCFCFDIVDELLPDGTAVRKRVWDSCLTYTFAQVAGGHFRPDIWARYRHFVLHKFCFWPRQFGVMGCVGCGRCITWCPAGIDIRETIRRILEGVRE